MVNRTTSFLICLLLALMHLIVISSTSFAKEQERRIALIIGNSDYAHVPGLDNPANDAELIGSILEGVGFELVGGGPQLDLDRRSFERAIRDFGSELAEGGVGMFYYAGHGIEHMGTNYMVPVDAVLNNIADVDFELVNASLLLRQRQFANNRLTIIVLDACRNNPFVSSASTRSLDRGLSRMDAPAGTIISFATRPGDVAIDGQGANSPFAIALAEALETEDLGVFEMFNRVGVLVKKNTGGRQEPWISYSPIEGQFYFNGQERKEPTVVASTEQFQSQYELAFWDAIKNSKNADDFKAYLEQYPNGVFQQLAKIRAAQPGPQKSSTSGQQTEKAVAKPGISADDEKPLVVDLPTTPVVLVKPKIIWTDPTGTGEIIGRLAAGSNVIMEEPADVPGWYLVTFNDTTGYVKIPSSELTAIRATAETGKWAATSNNIRTSVHSSSGTAQVAALGDSATASDAGRASKNPAPSADSGLVQSGAKDLAGAAATAASAPKALSSSDTADVVSKVEKPKADDGDKADRVTVAKLSTEPVAVDKSATAPEPALPADTTADELIVELDGWWKGPTTLESDIDMAEGEKCNVLGRLSIKIKGTSVNGTARLRKSGFQIVFGEIDEEGNILSLRTTDEIFSFSGNIFDGSFEGRASGCAGSFKLTKAEK